MKNQAKILYFGIVVFSTTTLSVCVLMQRNPDNYIELPASDQIDHITASANALRSIGSDEVPAFRIPESYHVAILAAFAPAKKCSQFPSTSETLGHVIVTTKDKQQIDIAFCASYQNPIYFFINGEKCIRAGEYKPLWVDGDVTAYGDESLMLYSVLKELYHLEQTTIAARKKIATQIEHLEKSRGVK